MSTKTNRLASGKTARLVLGTVAASALCVASATPAMADDFFEREGISAGEVIAGALVIGGIAALAGAFDGDDDDKRRYAYNDRDYHHDYGRTGYALSPRVAVDRCVRAAESEARRYGGYRYADVTDVRDIDRTRNGYKVKGRIVVDGPTRWRGGHDRGSFTCRLDGRGAPLIDFDDVRGLR